MKKKDKSKKSSLGEPLIGVLVDIPRITPD